MGVGADRRAQRRVSGAQARHDRAACSAAGPSMLLSATARSPAHACCLYAPMVAKVLVHSSPREGQGGEGGRLDCPMQRHGVPGSCTRGLPSGQLSSSSASALNPGSPLTAAVCHPAHPAYHRDTVAACQPDPTQGAAWRL